jgi:predicted amidophosphoribosyltransferase
MTVNLDDVDFGSSKCICPKCGEEVPHAKRGVPCSQVNCPKCGTPMTGRKCLGGDD